MTLPSNAIETETRPIDSLVTRGEGGMLYGVGRKIGRRVVSGIRPVKEPGQMGYVIWYEIEVDGVVWRRVNGEAVEHVEYKLSENTEAPVRRDSVHDLPF